MIQISKLQNPNLKLTQNNRIVQVIVLKRDGGEALIEINGQHLKARLSTDAPDTFLALVQKTGDNIQLRILDSFQQTQEYQNILKQDLLDKAKDFLLASNLPLSSDFVEDALFIIQYGLPLKEQTLKLFHQIKLRFGQEFGTFILSLLQKQVSLNEKDAELLYHIDAILENWIKEQKDAKEEFQGNRKKEDLLKIMEEILSFHSDPKISYVYFKNKDRQEFLRKKTDKQTDKQKTWTFDVSPSAGLNAWLKVTESEQQFSAILSLDPALYLHLDPSETERLNQSITNKVHKKWNLEIIEKENKNIHPFASEIIKVSEGTTGINIFV